MAFPDDNCNSGDSSHDNGDGTSHETSWWNDGDGVSHRESYNVDSEGNVTDYHYTQNDGQGNSYSYNYHNETWSEHHNN